jgi:hypothetical protein
LVVHFIDDDGGFVAWRDAHQNGFVVNHDREPRPEYLKLHRASCSSLQGEPTGRGKNWTSAYAKTCSESLDDLRAWARGVGGRLDPCGYCAPR